MSFHTHFAVLHQRYSCLQNTLPLAFCLISRSQFLKFSKRYKSQNHELQLKFDTLFGGDKLKFPYHASCHWGQARSSHGAWYPIGNNLIWVSASYEFVGYFKLYFMHKQPILIESANYSVLSLIKLEFTSTCNSSTPGPFHITWGPCSQQLSKMSELVTIFLILFEKMIGGGCSQRNT